jgi:hypothetical protein
LGASGWACRVSTLRRSTRRCMRICVLGVVCLRLWRQSGHGCASSLEVDCTLAVAHALVPAMFAGCPLVPETALLVALRPCQVCTVCKRAMQYRHHRAITALPHSVSFCMSPSVCACINVTVDGHDGRLDMFSLGGRVPASHMFHALAWASLTQLLQLAEGCWLSQQHGDWMLIWCTKTSQCPIICDIGC